MEVILLERVENLGQMGDVVKVRPGYARNFLLPQNKALRANETNRKVFENQRAELETRNLEKRKDAEIAAEKLEGRSFVVIRQASEMGLLYGSVSTRDIAETASAEGAHITRNQVRLDKPLKTLGIFKVRIVLHPEVSSTIEVNIARSEDEAERQARGENIFARDDDDMDGDDADAPEFFDEASGAAVDAQTGGDEGDSEADAAQTE